jgi:hypothetical protein
MHDVRAHGIHALPEFSGKLWIDQWWGVATILAGVRERQAPSRAAESVHFDSVEHLSSVRPLSGGHDNVMTLPTELQRKGTNVSLHSADLRRIEVRYQ